MNTYKLCFLLFLINFSFACSSGDDTEMETETETEMEMEMEMEMEEVDCLGSVGFLEDGMPVSLPVLNEKAFFILKDPSPFDANGVSRAFALRLQFQFEVFDIALEHNVADENSCIPLGIYSTETLSGSDGILTFAYMRELQDNWFASAGNGTGILEITKCDFENKLISGTFSCTMVPGIGSDQLEITAGSFEDVCLNF